MAGPLAQMVRAKHPGAYDDLSDEQLEQAVVAKYPGVYDDLIEKKESTSGPARRFAEGAGEMLNPVTMATGLYRTVRHPIDTATAIYGQQGQEFDKAVQAGREGRYSEMAGHGTAAFLPVVGPLAASIGEQAGSGDIAGAAGKLAGGALAWEAPKILKKVLPAKVGIAARAGREAELARFGLEHGVPVDVASATANPVARGAQKLATNTSLAGAVIGTNAAKARATALATLGEQLAAKGYAGAATKETAGAAAKSGVETSIRGFDDAANTHYGKLREMEAGATPSELVTKAEAVATDPKVLDRRFILRWLADDLDEFKFQKSSRMRGQQAVDEMEKAATQEEGYRAVYAPRVAGSPVQDTLNMAGVKGTKAEIAERISKQLQSGKIDPKLEAVADAYAEAWDGERFDFDLVNGDTLAKAGVMRRAMKSPWISADSGEPGASRYFPESATPEVPKPVETKSLQAPVDLKSVKPMLKPVLDRLNRKKAGIGSLQGGEAKAWEALDALVNGEDYASLSDVDGYLGQLKSMARGAEMPELRSAGQGAAAFAVSKLDQAVMNSAKALGPEAVSALKAGRQATRQKYAAAEVLDAMNKEPVKTANAATAPQDAAIVHLRELQRYAPDSLPQVGKAVLSEMLGEATKEGGFASTASLASKWEKLGPETKKLLFRDPQHVKDLDQFWALAKKTGENPNPSGSAFVGGLLAHGYMLRDPLTAVGYEIGAGTLAKLLNSPTATRVLVEGVSIPLKAKVAATARYARLTSLIEQATKSSATGTPVPQASRAQ